jgi:hypothetical protein
MRAKEFIIEGPFDTAKAAADTVSSIGSQLKGGFDQGYNKMDKLLSPSKWGKDSNDDKKSVAKFVPHTAKDVLKRASTGQNLYNDDIATIASIRSAISKGIVKTKQDPNAIDQALKALSQTKVANKDQASMFAALANEI